MSDFFSNGWSIYVAVADAGQHRRLPGAAVDRRAPQGRWPSDNTTGHVWDEDLREMNNPLPRWWMWLFVLTVVFALALPGRLSRAWAAYAGELRLDAARPSTTPRWRRPTQELAPLYAAVRGSAGRRRWPATPQAMAHRRAPVHQQLRAVPWLRRARQQGLSQPDRQRLAARRHAREDRRDHHRRPHRHDAADGRGGRQRRRRAATSRNYVLSLSGSPHDSMRGRSSARASSPPAPPATASTARATRRSARPT